MKYWSYVESDFYNYYSFNPLTLPWTKFRRLLFSLPPDSLFFTLLNHLNEKTSEAKKEVLRTPNKDAKNKLREALNLKKRNSTNTMSLDDFVLKKLYDYKLYNILGYFW